jgi:phosphodiesterase/alkaline phosphatase D-like protein
MLQASTTPTLTVSTARDMTRIHTVYTVPYSLDAAWDGYQAERQRIMQYIHDQQIDNVVVYTGDTHAFW